MVARAGGFSWAYYSAPIGKFLQDRDGCLAALAKYGAAAGAVEGGILSFTFTITFTGSGQPQD